MRTSKLFPPSPESIAEMNDLEDRGYHKSKLPSTNDNFPLDCLDCGAMIRYPDIHDKVCPGGK